MRLPFTRTEPAVHRDKPEPSPAPTLANTTIAAVYRGARVGGDFFDFVTTPSGRLLFLLLDIAGRREEAFNIAAAAQELLHDAGPKMFEDPEANESLVLTDLALELNRTIMEAAGGVRCAPAFLGCYQPALGMIWYLNAGHTPGLIREAAGTALLEANGLPLGLFSHATHDAQVCVLQPQSALLLVSKGLVEARSRGEEYGLERVRKLLDDTSFGDADDICRVLLESNDSFLQGTRTSRLPFGRSKEQNDRTAVAIMRSA
jgi:serine phosphatase RsbU (regulator of sigma subunit)